MSRKTTYNKDNKVHVTLATPRKIVEKTGTLYVVVNQNAGLVAITSI
jgi:hypothetical protein